MRDVIDNSGLTALFAPRSIAVVGASQEKTKIGGRPIDFLARLGYAGSVYPVNPRAGEIQGLRAYSSLRTIPAAVDLAIIAVPAPSVLDAVKEAAEEGARGLVVFSSGFAEIDDQGRTLQDQIRDVARRHRMRLLGPNCLGFANMATKAFASFSPVIGIGEPHAGRTAIVSQSGAFGAYAYSLARERRLGLSHWIATGNEADVGVADCIGWLAGSPDTDVILAYIEGTKDGRKLMAALEAARAAGKPVVVVKVGRSEIGAAAAASHTSAVAGEDAVYDAVLRQCGAYRARTIEEFFDVGYAASRCGLPRGNRIGLVTVSGGVGVLMADDAADGGLDVAPLDEAAQAQIKALVPLAATRNPVDTTGQVSSDMTILDRTLDIMLAADQYDMLAIFLSAAGLSPEFAPRMAKLVERVCAQRADLPVAACALLRRDVQAAIEQTGALAFEDPSRMMRTLAGLARLRAIGGARREPTPAPVPVVIPRGPLNEAAALARLADAGIPVVPSALCRDATDAIAAACRLGFPVVAKIASADIVHKSDVGGVRLNLADEAAVADAVEAILSAVAARAPAAVIDGVLVAPMVRGGVECFIGAHSDPTFGPIVVFGIGGLLVEVLRDVTFRAAPFDLGEARAMIDEIRSRPVLSGVRGHPPADVDALARALVAVSQFAANAGDSLVTIDINPFLVRPVGEGAVALDAVVVGRSSPNSHS